MKWTALPASRARIKPVFKTSLSKKLPSSMALVIRTESWSTMRPAPRF